MTWRAPRVPRIGPVGPLFGLARVHGASMRPTLDAGDRVLVGYRRRPRPGDVVVARFPDGATVIKRAVELRPTRTGEPGWWLLSDAPEAGVDSRHRGPVADTDVLGVVVGRCWPRPRRL